MATHSSVSLIQWLPYSRFFSEDCNIASSTIHNTKIRIVFINATISLLGRFLTRVIFLLHFVELTSCKLLWKMAKFLWIISSTVKSCYTVCVNIFYYLLTTSSSSEENVNSNIGSFCFFDFT